jgi:hypothetical protein
MIGAQAKGLSQSPDFTDISKNDVLKKLRESHIC